MRGQKGLQPDQHKAFARRFGTLNIHPYVKGMKDHPELLEIIKEKEDKVNFGGGWHTDMSFEETPALGSISPRYRVAALWRGHAVCRPAGGL